MNKKLIALAVGAAMGIAPMAASAAKVTVYGHAQVEISSTDVDWTGSTVNDTDEIELQDNARGRLGVKASEKLGNGMTAIAKFEWKIDTTEGGSDTGDRESFVGLKGNFGTVQLGNLKSAYKYTGGVKYDIFVATALEARNRGGMSSVPHAGNRASGPAPSYLGHSAYGHSSFLENSIGYITPKMNGFQGWLTYSPDETGENRGDDGDLSASLKYNNGPMELGVAYINNDDNSAAIPGNGGDGWKLLGSYKFGNHKVMGQYEFLDSDAAGDVDVYFLAYHFKSGNNTFIGQYGNTDFKDFSVADNVDVWTIGMTHNLSKKTRLHVGYSNSDWDSVVEESVFSAGLRMIF